MCHRCVIVKRDGGHLLAWSRGELAKHLGCKVPQIQKLGEGWPRLGFRDCLCSVDFEVIAKRHKMTHMQPGSDGPFWDDHVLTEIDASGGEGV